MLRSKLKCSKLETQACNYIGMQWLIQTGSAKKNNTEQKAEWLCWQRCSKSFHFTFHMCMLYSSFSKFQRHYIQKPFLFLYLCTTQQIANVSGGEWAELSLHHHSHNLFCFLLKRKEEGRKGRQKQGGQKRSVWDKREQRKLPGLQQHSFSVRHLLFYCNLMALLSPGASRQSPLYHMAIISVALLCDSLTLSTVTCDPL